MTEESFYTSGIIIVLYNPCEEHIKNVVKSLYEQVNYLCILDNTPNIDHSEWFIDYYNINYIPSKKNEGIATAQNKGISYLSKLNCDYIIFLDQNSKVTSDYPKRIIKEYRRIKINIKNLFLLGPTMINGRTKDEYKPIMSMETSVLGFIEKKDIISSGSCLQTNLISEVGPLDESLFIDCVDQEWCWRALSHNYKSGITTKIQLIHYVGQKEKKILGCLIIISSPIRYYYQTRNWLWLMRRNYVPIKWKINTSIKRIIYPIFYPFLTKDWIKIYKNIGKGLVAGFKITHHDNK